MKKNFIEGLWNKPTLLSIVGIIVLIIGIPSVIVLSNQYRGGMGAFFILAGIIIFIPFLVIDRILVNRIKQLKLSIFELIVILIVILFYNI